MTGSTARISLVAVLPLLAACDPSFVKSFPIEAAPGGTAEFPADELDYIATTFEFDRADAPLWQRERLDDEGRVLLVYYERKLPGTSNFQSLSIVELPIDGQLRMDVVAFIALGEPDQLRGFRLAVSTLLCERGYTVAGTDDCGMTRTAPVPD